MPGGMDTEDLGADRNHHGADPGRRRHRGPKGKATLEAAKKAWRLILVAVLLASALLVMAFRDHTPKVIEKQETKTTIEKHDTKIVIVPSLTPVPETNTIISPRPGPTVTRTSRPSPRPRPSRSPSPSPSPTPSCRVQVIFCL